MGCMVLSYRDPYTVSPFLSNSFEYLYSSKIIRHKEKESVCTNIPSDAVITTPSAHLRHQLQLCDHIVCKHELVFESHQAEFAGTHHLFNKGTRESLCGFNLLRCEHVEDGPRPASDSLAQSDRFDNPHQLQKDRMENTERYYQNCSH